MNHDDVFTASYQLGSSIESHGQYPSAISAKGHFYGGHLSDREICWERSLYTEKGKTHSKEARELSRAAFQMQEQIRQGNTDVVLPIIAYYGTGRLWARKSFSNKRSETIQRSNRFSGYIDCLERGLNPSLMNKWFEKMTLQSAQEEQLLPELEVVKATLEQFLAESAGYDSARLQFRIKSLELEITYKDSAGQTQIMPVRKLSDGYRTSLTMVADIAYRMAVLNPQLLENIVKQTPGVVLIDEIDLHLHPKWQQHIIKDLVTLFPCVQFIVTTHAPSVISSVPAEQILILDDGEVYSPQIRTYGKDANSILAYLMEANERPIEVLDKINQFNSALDEEQFSLADKILEELEETLGPDDKELIRYRVILEFEKTEASFDKN
jgi:predicted ATP-binding protein involved in virulence